MNANTVTKIASACMMGVLSFALIFPSYADENKKNKKSEYEKYEKQTLVKKDLPALGAGTATYAGAAMSESASVKAIEKMYKKYSVRRFMEWHMDDIYKELRSTLIGESRYAELAKLNLHYANLKGMRVLEKVSGGFTVLALGSTIYRVANIARIDIESMIHGGDQTAVNDNARSSSNVKSFYEKSKSDKNHSPAASATKK